MECQRQWEQQQFQTQHCGGMQEGMWDIPPLAMR